MTIEELFNSKGYSYYPTDKNTHHRYLGIYGELLGKWEKETINILEVGCYKNGSLKLLEEFFTSANIIGFDIKPYEGAVELNRAKVYMEDFYSSNRELPEFHIAIDDGDHSVPSQLAFVRKVYPKLAVGGILIVEDVMPGFKEHFDSLNIPYTAMAFYPPTDQEDDRLILMRK